MAKLFRKKGNQQENEIDLTPMLDVVFIMLIFFIVTASFVQEVGFDVTRPPPSPPNQTPSELKNAVFEITENDEVFLNGLRIDSRAVRARIESILAENPEASVIVKAHEKSNTEIYVKIADSAYEVSSKLNVSLMLN